VDEARTGGEVTLGVWGGAGGCVVVIHNAMLQLRRMEECHFHHSGVALPFEVPSMAGLYVMSCKRV
jgi:hypothetical protein